MMELHSSYRQATIFDQLWLALARGLRRPAWLQGRRAWGWSFGLLAGLFGVIGAAFLLDALAPAAGNSALASLGSALLSLGVFRHFARCALPLLQPHVAHHGVSRVRAKKGATRPLVAPGVTRPATGGRADSAASAPLRPVSTLSAAERRAYLAGLRHAGVNVRIARALVSAGYLSGAALAGASDAQILAVRGVGPATLKKLRACFPSTPQAPG
ncbi:MAG: helix-hairpin-helix domain-containing protein [Gammaproteobacteria bacterium]|nr:helix-hairpin-helix domain-containing protein [Gammaproteobacteria bacterium]